MKACGLIVEYNPFHNGHLHHAQSAKIKTEADCVIAVMSGPFLQRGEPAIIDKYHRAKAALESGVDIVLELPYAYAVQSSELFAKGSVRTLHEIGVSTVCFGSESGNINHFLKGYQTLKKQENNYTSVLKKYLSEGMSYPQASEYAYKTIGLTTGGIDLSKPNNILGFSYINEILSNELKITPATIKRINSDFHDNTMKGSISSATSIRQQLLDEDNINSETTQTIPLPTAKQLLKYKDQATWHHWEQYFPFLHYQVTSMTLKELRMIQGVDEGLEHRIKRTAKRATSFLSWMQAMKTKRYTWTRLQRMFVHILTNTKKSDLHIINNKDSVPYIRLIGLSEVGQTYLNTKKKNITVPIISQVSRDPHPILAVDEKVNQIYYSILSPQKRMKLQQQELKPPIFSSQL